MISTISLYKSQNEYQYSQKQKSQKNIPTNNCILSGEERVEIEMIAYSFHSYYDRVEWQLRER